MFIVSIMYYKTNGTCHIKLLYFQQDEYNIIFGHIFGGKTIIS